MGLALLVALSSLAILAASPAHGQAPSTNVLSYRVDGAVNYSDLGGEPFWSGIAWTDMPLSASISLGGGQTPDLEIKSANDGFNVFALFRT